MTNDPSSRHAGAKTYRVNPDVQLLEPRIREALQPTRRHVATGSDRLDLVAATYLGDPHLYWRIADANPSVPPEQLTEPGRVVDIPGPTP